VHKKEEHKRRLSDCNSEGDDGIKNAEILKCCKDSEPRKDKKDKPDHYIDLR